MDEQYSVLEKIEILVGSNAIKSDLCITPTTIQIVAHTDWHCHYSLFVEWIALPPPLSNKWAVYEEFSSNDLLNGLDECLEHEMHIERECITPVLVKKWLETWIGIFYGERVNLMNDEKKNQDLERAKQEFQNFIHQTGSMMESWGSQKADFDKNMTLWTKPVVLEVKPEGDQESD